MILLGFSDLVVAGMYSSFTQIMPLSLQFQKMKEEQPRTKKLTRPGIFCELGPRGTVMECYNDFYEWRVLKRSSLPLWGDVNADKQVRSRLVMFPKEENSPSKLKELLESKGFLLE